MVIYQTTLKIFQYKNKSWQIEEASSSPFEYDQYAFHGVQNLIIVK